jgi:hypothetical protein
MACQYEEKLTSWLLGDLSPQEQDEITSHVFRCASCRKECDELRRVLFPLRSALQKDQHLFKTKRNIHWTQRLLVAPWVRQAAVLLLSCSIVCAVMTLFYHQVTRDRTLEGPVTHITFEKREIPPPPLEPLVMPSGKPQDPFAHLNIVDELRLADIDEVPMPALSGYDWTPQFMTLNQLAMWQALGKGSESVHDKLMRELPDARWDLHAGPLRRLKKTHQSAVSYGPTVYASPRYEGSTNTMPGTLK